MKEKTVDPNEIRKVYEEEGIQAVADYIGCSVPTAYKLLDESGVPRKSPKTATRYKIAKED